MIKDLFSTTPGLKSRNFGPILSCAEDQLHIISMNIQSAGKERLNYISRYLIEQDPDIIILSEVVQKKATHTFLEYLAQHGFAGMSLRDHSQDRYNALIGRRVMGKELPIQTASLSSRGAITKIDIRFCSPLYIVGLYSPAFNAKNTDVRRIFFKDLLERVINRLCQAQNNVLIVGDLNLVEERYHRHVPDLSHDSAPYLKAFDEIGLRDELRFRYNDTPQYTWICPRTGEGQRLDHVFSFGAVGDWIDDIQIDHQVRYSKLSDHSAVNIKLTPKAN